jgi:DNA-binding transcriptional MerR regulator
MGLMGIGDFATQSWLSPRALRLYDELGLLRPAQVDPQTGYRWYAPEQLEQARLVASLRQLQLPLAQVKLILGLDAPTAAEQIARCWAEAETSHAARRELAGYLIDRLNGKAPVMYDVQVRDMPARSLLCVLRRAHTQETMAMGRDLIARLRPVAAPQHGDPVTAPFAIYYGQVSEDSDGPVEWCWPVPDDQAADLAARFDDLTLRTEPAHQEAFVDVGKASIELEQLVPYIESLTAWISEQHRQPAGGLRQLLIANRDSGGQGPDGQWAFALAAS